MLLGGWLAGATRLASLDGFEGLQELRAGGATEAKLGGKEGMPVGLAAAGLLERSAATLASVDFRSAARACACVRMCARAYLCVGRGRGMDAAGGLAGGGDAAGVALPPPDIPPAAICRYAPCVCQTHTHTQPRAPCRGGRGKG